MSATKSSLPEVDLAKIRRYAEGRVPAHARHQVRIELEVSRGAVTLVECRAPWTPEVGPEWSCHPIAWLRFGAATSTWMLYWCDRNLIWHRYKDVDAAPFVDPLLAEIAADPFGIFCQTQVVITSVRMTA